MTSETDDALNQQLAEVLASSRKTKALIDGAAADREKAYTPNRDKESELLANLLTTNSLSLGALIRLLEPMNLSKPVQNPDKV